MLQNRRARDDLGNIGGYRIGFQGTFRVEQAHTV